MVDVLYSLKNLSLDVKNAHTRERVELIQKCVVFSIGGLFLIGFVFQTKRMKRQEIPQPIGV